ncbi:hypothetical protein P280DRAFT_470676 [Massarina eburnea CBS 473.64]|uniref:Uncharacterized protein n=1 Tax=Massarina eburnea CBS 473.64 TaxID=1395130 RepID=A0A6A6RUR5_9PLEO|nr:hypothetical protein P280DRAFT_470676 [Massarina eburnea CBS 473.64]
MHTQSKPPPHHLPSTPATESNSTNTTQGPVVAENIGKPASKEELKKRSEELNK